MAASNPNPVEVFDLRKIRRLVELMEDHDLCEIDLRQGNARVRIRRGAGVNGIEDAPSVAGTSRPAAQTPKAPDPSPPDDSHISVIKSPMVGTFYTSPNPDAEPFVKVGDPVGPDTTVCIVEAMKVFNEIQADVSGTIVAVLVENGEPIEFGQPLFKVDTRQ